MPENTEWRLWKSEGCALDAWKHFGSIGGEDKARMIQIVTWLLGFSAAIIGLYVSDKAIEGREVYLFLIGAGISLLAMYVSLMYAGYAARNWATADKIAKAYDWSLLLPDVAEFSQSGPPILGPLADHFATPCEDTIAPVFVVFFAFSAISLGLHTGLLLCTAMQ